MKQCAIRLSVVALILSSMLSIPAYASQAVGLLLTWQDDPTTTMTIDWHTAPGTWAPTLQYRQDGAEHSDQWLQATADTRPFPFSDRRIHRVALEGLMPGTDYVFRINDSQEWRFRTMPATLDRPLVFAKGGDMNVGQSARRTVREAAKHDLDFLLIGGDIAYANGDPERIGRWYDWMDIIMNDLITADGRAIPVIAGIGNHEVFSTHRYDEEIAQLYYEHFGLRTGDSPFYYSLFALPVQRGYFAIDFADYLSIVLLDTNHTTRIVGEQTEWLAYTLAARQSQTHLFPIYHVPGYPSVRSFDGGTSVQVRENWSPLFERYGVAVAFENHDHIYKRTHALRAGELDPNGVVYIGDGSMGVGVREIGRNQPQEGPAWYLAEAASVNHFILVTLEGESSRFEAYDNEGNLIDEYAVLTRHRHQVALP